MSSSHLFLGLPVALLVLYLELSSGFHSAAHSVMWRFSVPVSISFFVSLVPASNLCAFHLFHGFICASFYVFNPVFFFNQCGINFNVGIVFE